MPRVLMRLSEREILTHAGKIAHGEDALTHANTEFDQFIKKSL